jgi:hypothetical protein
MQEQGELLRADLAAKSTPDWILFIFCARGGHGAYCLAERKNSPYDAVNDFTWTRTEPELIHLAITVAPDSPLKHLMIFEARRGVSRVNTPTLLLDVGTAMHLMAERIFSDAKSGCCSCTL